jgi:predicted metal-dependent peptidase
MTNVIEQFDLDRYIYNLLQNEPFFAEISRHVEKRSSTAIPTAGVRITKEGQFEMMYNPKFFEGLTREQRAGVIKHEFYHLVFGHVTDRMPDGKMSKRWNVATDLAINSHIKDELPSMACIPGVGPFKDLPLFESAEYYYNHLPQKDDKKGEGLGQGSPDSGGEGEPDSFDDHSEWGENAENLDPGLRELAKERLREMMRSAAEEANKSSNGWGSVTHNIRKDIMDRISGKIDWRAVLRYFIKTSQRSAKTSTVKRINKRYAYIHPGQKVLRHAKIATFTVVPFDTQVDDKLVYVWKKGMSRRKERVKYGGTDFDAPTKYVNDKGFDGHIVLTDMQAPKPITSKCQRMWMTTKDCMSSMPFKTHERVIPVE